MDIIETVYKTILQHDMIAKGDKVVVAISGGPDSVFLLHALTSLKKRLAIPDLTACNLDHGIRGRESQRDSLFAKRLAKDLGVKFIHKRINLGATGGTGGLSCEEEARSERYDFFIAAAKSAGANVIATGHTLDDQAETVLMRILKGVSMKGACGIPPVREYRRMRIIRPLIQVEKNRIKKYLDAHRMDYRIDRTNLEPVYFRNVVRNEIIPFLEKYNPVFKKALFNMAEDLREDMEFIAREKSKSAGLLKKRGKGVDVDIMNIVLQPRAMQKALLRECLERSGGNLKKLSRKHWKDIEGLVNRMHRGANVDLPGCIRVTKKDKTISFRKLR